MGASDDGSSDDARLKTIVELCVKAENAPDAEPERALDAMRAVLKHSETTFESSTLSSTDFARCGKMINGLRKRHADARVRDAAAAVKKAWTDMILANAGVGEKKEQKVASKAEKATEGDEGGEEAHGTDARTDVKSRLTRTADAARDRTREIFADALAMCIADGAVEASNAGKLAAIADQIEEAMTAKWPEGGKDYKAKVRQLAFNMRDPKNPDLRTNLAMGEISADVLIDLTPEELGSNERRQANEKIREFAEWEAVRGQQQEASTDAFKCGKCKQRKCTYYQLQTRSADEPMTTFVTCVNCGNRWKFC